MAEIAQCCGTTCDKAKACKEQAKVVAAFDEVDRLVREFDPEAPVSSVEFLETAFESLWEAMTLLR